MVKPCSRVAASLTGRPSRLAATATSAVRCGQGALRAESAADIAADHADIVRLNPKLLGEAVLHAVDVLARLVERSACRRPDAGRGEQLDRIMVLGRRRIAGVDFDRRRGERRDRESPTLGSSCFLSTCAPAWSPSRRIEGRARALLVVVERRPARRLARRLEGLGNDHRDDLAVMPDLGELSGTIELPACPPSEKNFTGRTRLAILDGSKCRARPARRAPSSRSNARIAARDRARDQTAKAGLATGSSDP